MRSQCLVGALAVVIVGVFARAGPRGWPGPDGRGGDGEVADLMG